MKGQGTHDRYAPPFLAEGSRGLLCGISAYLIWGGAFPLYFKALSEVPLLQIVAHRIVWSLVFLLFLNCGRWDGIRQALARRSLPLLMMTALLIATNWLLFIYAIVAGQILQASLGYFMTPLANVLLGRVFLRERLNPVQVLSLSLAMAGVLVSVIRFGSVPWIALVLALSFGFYGLLRKVVKADALAGLTVETALLAPLAGAYICFVAWRGDGVLFVSGLETDFLLVMAGVLTAVPLLLFAAAARRLRLTTIGFLQYIAPSLQFCLAIFVYGETFSGGQMVSFALIWASLFFYSWSAWRVVNPSRGKFSEKSPQSA